MYFIFKVQCNLHTMFCVSVAHFNAFETRKGTEKKLTLENAKDIQGNVGI